MIAYADAEIDELEGGEDDNTRAAGPMTVYTPLPPENTVLLAL